MAAGMGMLGGAPRQALGGAASAAGAPGATKGPPPQVGMGMKGPPPMGGRPGGFPKGAPPQTPPGGFGVSGMRPGAPPIGRDGAPPPMAGTSPRLPPGGPGGIPGAGPMARPPTMTGTMPGGRQRQMQTIERFQAGRPAPTPVGTMPAMTSNKGLAGLTSPPIR